MFPYNTMDMWLFCAQAVFTRSIYPGAWKSVNMAENHENTSVDIPIPNISSMLLTYYTKVNIVLVSVYLGLLALGFWNKCFIM